jgi:imidazolonepropionase
MGEERFLLRLREASQVVCVGTGGAEFHSSKETMNDLHIVENGTVLIGLDGRIADVGVHAEVEARHPNATFEKDVDCKGKSIVPGLCDGHTHPVWEGDRVHEFAMKLAGAT